MKKLFTIILTITILLSAVSSSYAAEYTDVSSSNWAYSAVKAMSEKTIVKGYPDGSFKPDNTVTYGEFIKMSLIAATGNDVGNSDADNWALNYYNEAKKQGYFTKYDIPQSKLDENITRAHMALIISSILGDVTIENYDKIQKGITDITSKTEYEYDITKAYAMGILTGYTDKTFKPNKTLSRAEAATVIYRLVDESKRVLPDITGGTETKETITASVGGTTFTYEVEKVQLGYNGIQKIETLQNGKIAIYSTVQYDGIRVLIGNQMVPLVGYSSGLNYAVKDGYYVYLANPATASINITGQNPSLLFVYNRNDDMPDTTYRYTDVTL